MKYLLEIYFDTTISHRSELSWIAAAVETECVINFLGIYRETLSLSAQCVISTYRLASILKLLEGHLSGTFSLPACLLITLSHCRPALSGSATSAHGIKLKCQVSCYFRRQSCQTLQRQELQPTLAPASAATPCQIACYKFSANQIELGILCKQLELFLALLMCCTWPTCGAGENQKTWHFI